ncbi:hypothetical protein [Enhygromyxa salina]|uniref:Uncharacterized protein n=1 Tax=Enhygromyxa salina TaxID=215803 RepID=A0A2S9Y5Z9_9BACT|nr:hypothetical protein [Enhygromyxa salina]PRQ00431.1 hypothetical protein ENSA7_59250 [Enhygromyxa salina]
MSDIVFSPWPHAEREASPGSAEVLYLRRALFVLQGRYWNPLTQSDTPLPPHRWVLVHSGEVFSEGTDSDVEGVSTIFDPPLDSVAADDTWELMLIPLFEGRADSNTYAELGWAWIDVEAGVWVTGEELRTDQPRNLEYAKFAARPLLGIPLWSTRRKARIGGGFAQGGPDLQRFEAHGELSTSELRPFGSRSAPWVMQIDHGWLRTHVQFRFYDHTRRVERPIPAGVLLASVDQDTWAVHGRSSVVTPEGSIYVLHALTEANAGALMYQFALPGFARFRLEDDALDEFDKARDGASSFAYEREAPGLLGTHYFLPEEWRSRGMEAWVGDREACAELRRSFAEFRTAGQDPAEPICFHLDDTVTFSGKYHGKRIALLDHYLGIRDQASNEYGLVPWSTHEVTGFPLRGEEAVFVRGEGIEKVTRAIGYGGAFLEIAFQRKYAMSANEEWVGARWARPPHLHGDLTTSDLASIHLIDVRYLSYNRQGYRVKLAHLVVHISSFVLAPSEDNKPDDPRGEQNLANTEGVPLIQHLLHVSALTWDQCHPAHGDPSDKKEYLAVPAGGLVDGVTVLKIRHFFSCRETDDGRDGHGPHSSIQVHPQPGRATGGNPMHLYLVRGSNTKAHDDETPEHAPAPRPHSFEPAPWPTHDRVDGVAGHSSTVTHELGHQMGLPDEYIERVQPTRGLAGRLPPFFLTHEAYPYALATISLMCKNILPRLRYSWELLRCHHRAKKAPKWFGQLGPFFPQLSTPDHGVLDYDLDYASGPLWTPVLSGRIGHCSAHLFAARRDESLAGPMMAQPKDGVSSVPFDGILVVTIRYWFSFENSTDAKSDWGTMTQFGLEFQQREKQPRVYIHSPAAPEYRNVLLRIEPRFEYEPYPYRPDIVNADPPTAQDADVEVTVRRRPAHNRTVSVSGKRLKVHIDRPDVDPWLLRVALDPQRWMKRHDGKPLRDNEFTILATWLGSTLGRAPGSLKRFSK